MKKYLKLLWLNIKYFFYIANTNVKRVEYEAALIKQQDCFKSYELPGYYEEKFGEREYLYIPDNYPVARYLTWKEYKMLNNLPEFNTLWLGSLISDLEEFILIISSPDIELKYKNRSFNQPIDILTMETLNKYKYFMNLLDKVFHENSNPESIDYVVNLRSYLFSDNHITYSANELEYYTSSSNTFEDGIKRLKLVQTKFKVFKDYVDKRN